MPQGFCRLGAALVVVVGSLVVAPAARPAAPTDFALVKSGLDSSLARGRLEPDEVTEYKAIAYRATRAIRRLPGTRASNLSAVLGLVARQRRAYTRERAVALFGMLDLNIRYLVRHSMPPAGTDVLDEDGVVYRSFPGQGLEFHPLANFSRLTQLVSAGRDDDGLWLAQALEDRAVPRDGTLTWEYYFPFGGGSPPWTSGMAQAVAAAAYARADLTWEAEHAYAAIRKGLLLWLDGRPWIRLYRFSSMAVLNAQLQTALSVEQYAQLAGDEGASRFAAVLRETAAELLPRFDTGAWSLYSLNGAEAALNYQRYVVSLLGRLAAQTGEQTWADWQLRFDDQLHEPPTIVARRPVAAVAHRRSARITFWLSKVSRVTISIGGKARAVWLSHGTHTLLWYPGRRRPGVYAGSLRAVDLAGNRARVALAPVRVRRR